MTDRHRGDAPKKRSGNPNPTEARRAKARRRARKAADMELARRVAWTAIREAERILLDADSDAETRLRAIHAISQSMSTYIKISEAAELEARVSELERAFQQRDQPHMRRAI